MTADNSSDQVPPMLRRFGDVIQAIAVLAIVGLAVAVVDMRVSVAQMQTQLRSLREIVDIQMANNDLSMKAQAAIIERVTAGGFDANAGRALTARVEKTEDKLELLGRELAVAVARIDSQLREIEKDLSRTEIGKMNGDKR
jgi:hypothetical protein